MSGRTGWFWFAVFNFVFWLLCGQDDLEMVIGFWGSLILSHLDDE